MKICLAASAGGHLTQLLRLSDIWEDKPCFFVTTGDMMVRQLSNKATTYIIKKANRQHPLLLMHMLCKCLYIMLKERPDVVISTGAALGCILCLLAKLAGKKVVWVETISIVDRLSLSGNIIRPFADLFLVQWPKLAKRYKGVKYVGTVI